MKDCNIKMSKMLEYRFNVPFSSSIFNRRSIKLKKSLNNRKYLNDELVQSWSVISIVIIFAIIELEATLDVWLTFIRAGNHFLHILCIIVACSIQKKKKKKKTEKRIRWIINWFANRSFCEFKRVCNKPLDQTN